MALRYLYCSAVVLNVCVAALFISSQTGIAHAGDRQEIRFYKANRQLQTDLIWFTKKKGQLPGCHNFLKKTRVYIAKQIGFEGCTLYTKKNCARDSLMTSTRKKDDTPVTQLSEGYSWLPVSDHKRGPQIRSWSCE